MKKDEKFQIVKVTMEVEYIVPDSVCQGNGQTVDEVLDDWFNKYDINRYHATRDTCRVGNATKVLKVEKVNE